MYVHAALWCARVTQYVCTRAPALMRLYQLLFADWRAEMSWRTRNAQPTHSEQLEKMCSEDLENALLKRYEQLRSNWDSINSFYSSYKTKPSGFFSVLNHTRFEFDVVKDVHQQTLKMRILCSSVVSVDAINPYSVCVSSAFRRRAFCVLWLNDERRRSKYR